MADRVSLHEGDVELVTAVRVEQLGAHDHVRVWVRGGMAGELVCDAGDGDRLATLLTRSGAVRKLCEAIGHENVMRAVEACWRDELSRTPDRGRELTVGPRALELVRCGCRAGCPWCGGSRVLTRRVADAREQLSSDAHAIQLEAELSGIYEGRRGRRVQVAEGVDDDGVVWCKECGQAHALVSDGSLCGDCGDVA